MSIVDFSYQSMGSIIIIGILLLSTLVSTGLLISFYDTIYKKNKDINALNKLIKSYQTLEVSLRERLEYKEGMLREYSGALHRAKEDDLPIGVEGDRRIMYSSDDCDQCNQDGEDKCSVKNDSSNSSFINQYKLGVRSIHKTHSLATTSSRDGFTIYCRSCGIMDDLSKKCKPITHGKITTPTGTIHIS